MKYLTVLFLMITGTVYSQQSNERPKRTAVEEALLDSAAKYEKAKQAIVYLNVAYEYRGKEIQDLREALRLSDLQVTVQKQSFDQQIADLKKLPKGRWWKGFKVGFGSGLLAGAIFGSTTQ